MKEPYWELAFAVDANSPNNSDALSDYDNFVDIFYSSETRKGQVASVYELFDKNMSVFKTERIYNWDYVTQVCGIHWFYLVIFFLFFLS